MKTFPALSCWTLTSAVLVGAVRFADAATAAALPQEPAGVIETASPPKLGPVTDQPVDAFRLDLLHLAYQAAAAFPAQPPYDKDRASAQELVVLSCLELDQPTLALRFARQIGNWRRGTALADCAHYGALHGDLDGANAHLAAAEKVAEDMKQNPNEQAWRHDSIVVKVARTRAWLGDRQEAERLTAGVDRASGQAFDSGWASSVASRADLIPADRVDAELSALDGVITSASSGEAFNAVSVCIRLYDRFYGDAEIRRKVETRVRTRDSKLPPDLQATNLIQLARIAAAHGDHDAATEQLAEARKYIETSELAGEYRLAFVPAMARVRHLAGDTGAAQGELEQGLATYHEQREGYRSTKRAEILRPFAEAYQAMGEQERARGIYELVVEEGFENPNSRPRAHDISQTCLSMARAAFAPDAKLLARIREIVQGLGAAW